MSLVALGLPFALLGMNGCGGGGGNVAIPTSTPGPTATSIPVGANTVAISSVSSSSNVNKANFIPTDRQSGGIGEYVLSSSDASGNSRQVTINIAEGNAAIGKQYFISSVQSPSNAYVTYQQASSENSTPLIWVGASGTCIVDSVSGTATTGFTYHFRIINAKMVGNSQSDDLGNSVSVGNFVLNFDGTATQ